MLTENITRNYDTQYCDCFRYKDIAIIGHFLATGF